MKLRILQIVNKALPKHDYRLALSNIDALDVSYVMPANPDEYPCHKLIRINLFGGFSLLKEISVFFRLILVLAKGRFEIIHWYSSKYYLLGPLVASLFCRSKHIITINGFGRVFVEPKFAFLRPFFLYLLKHSLGKSVFGKVQNKDDFCFLARLIGPNTKIRLVYSGLEDTYSLTRKPSTKLRILNISRLLKSKGIEDFLEIAEVARCSRQDMEFILIGESGDPLIKEKVLEQSRQGVIKYFEHIDSSFDAYNSADIFLFTSYREGLPRVLIEAAACSLPLIGYDVTGVRDVILHGNNGFLVEPGATDTILGILVDYANDKDLVDRHGNNSRAVYKKCFNIEAYKLSMEKIYLEVGPAIS